jgi:hypothetical protein
MEIALRRLDGVDQVAISMEKQEVAVTYKGAASFQPKALREAVANASVSIVRFQIQARGRVQAQGDRQVFIAGKDRFLLVTPPKMPDDQTLLVNGEVFKDAVTPMELKVASFRVVPAQ